MWLPTTIPHYMVRNRHALASPAYYRQPLGYLLRFISAAFARRTPSAPKPALKILPHFNSSHARRCPLSTSATHGTSPEGAAMVFKGLPVKSPQNRDSVVLFLERQGLGPTDISRMLTRYPRLLSASVENTLEPRIRELLGEGISMHGITQLLAWAPGALLYGKALPRIRFWRAFLGNDEKRLLRAVKRNRGLIGSDIPGNVSPKIALLRRRGLSDGQIASVVEHVDFIGRRMEAVEEKLRHAEELGFRPTSGMFVRGLHVVTNVTRGSLEEKRRLMASYGWSEQEFTSALRMAPSFVLLTDKHIRAKMDFLTGEAGCDPSYIASHPVLLMCSLENRLMPRHGVMQILRPKGLDRGWSVAVAMIRSEREFVEKFVDRYKEDIPELCEAYASAGGGKIRPNVGAAQDEECVNTLSSSSSSAL